MGNIFTQRTISGKDLLPAVIYIVKYFLILLHCFVQACGHYLAGTLLPHNTDVTFPGRLRADSILSSVTRRGICDSELCSI